MYTLQYKDLQRYRSLSTRLDIIAGDTDSFFLEVEGIRLPELLNRMKEDKLLDTSSYDKD